MKGIYTLICEEHHIHSFAYILTPYSRIVRSFKQLQLSQHILHILLDSQLLETGSCLGYLYVVICENSSLSGTTPKTPCYISTQNITPFAHDYSPYQTRSKKITLGRKKTGTWMSIYRRQPKVQLSLTARLAGDTDRWSPCAEAAEKMLFQV